MKIITMSLMLPFGIAAYYLHRKHQKALYFNKNIQEKHHFVHKERALWGQKHPIIKMLFYTYRFLYLIIIFLPTLLFLPFAFFNRTKNIWLYLFLEGIKQAGATWIKAFQYLTHRRDVVGEEMAEMFSVLREHAPEHSEAQMRKTFKRVYNCEPEKMFQQFNPKPISAGSVSQVYKAKMRGQWVAVKVQHPNIYKYLQVDIDLLFKLSNFLSKISRKFQIPIKENSMKQLLGNQIYFLQEMRNLQIFNEIIDNPNVKFPIPYSESTNEILIESFVSGCTISHYIDNTHQLNKCIAMLGANAFFQMLMKHNFTHADCHGGNIYVQFQLNNNKLLETIKYYKNKCKNYIVTQFIRHWFKSQRLAQLCEQNRIYEQSIWDEMNKLGYKVQITLLDVGMVIYLTEWKKRHLAEFIGQVIKGQKQQCAQRIYEISTQDGKALVKGEHPEYVRQLELSFSILDNCDLAKLSAMEVVKGITMVIRKHSMKIDGQISVMLTNMLILEAMSKSLDPNINILRCAVPYLQNM